MRSTLTTAWRGFWRGLVGLLVFAQVAVAADQCLADRLLGVPEALSQSGAEHHRAMAAAPCVSDLMPANQARASETDRFVPDAGPGIPIAHAWAIAPDAGERARVHALARAAPARPLSFLNLRL